MKQTEIRYIPKENNEFRYSIGIDEYKELVAQGKIINNNTAIISNCWAKGTPTGVQVGLKRVETNDGISFFNVVRYKLPDYTMEIITNITSVEYNNIRKSSLFSKKDSLVSKQIEVQNEENLKLNYIISADFPSDKKEIVYLNFKKVSSLSTDLIIPKFLEGKVREV